MKKMFIHLLMSSIVIGLWISTFILGSSNPEAGEVVAGDTNMQIGDYMLLGKYEDDPIVWRCVDKDEKGPLILSNGIVCNKMFGVDNFWETSFLRGWLNSTVSEGEMQWMSELYARYPLWSRESYNEEKGFLNDDNFSQSERSVMKTVSQWTMLPENHLDLATNGNSQAYNAVKSSYMGGPRQGMTYYYYKLLELPDAYFGAAYQVSDTVFLLDEMQLYNMYMNLGTAVAQPILYDHVLYWSGYYWLRTPSTTYTLSSTFPDVTNYGGYGDGEYASIGSLGTGYTGVRPAFYLNTENTVILSGSGTEEDPYVIDGKADTDNEDNNSEESNTENNNENENENENEKKKDGISVYLNGSELCFDQSPIIENERTLVPFRAIFEALGAEVLWDYDTRTVTGELNDTMIQLTIGNETAYVNAEPILLDAQPKIMNDRTLVPLRFIAENFSFRVEWNEEEQRIDIIETDLLEDEGSCQGDSSIDDTMGV